MSRVLNFVFGFGLLGALIMSFVTPFIVSVLFTPPVSFGVNCEPAAVWSMNKLHISEGIGLAVGMIAGLGLAIWLRKREARAQIVEPKPL